MKYGGISFTEFLELTGCIVVASGGFSVLWHYVRNRDGDEFLLSQRSYRDGLTVLLNPTPDDIENTKKDEWYAWNSDKGLIIY